MKEKMLVIIVVKNSAVFLVIISEMMMHGENKNESKCKSGTLVCP